MYGPLAARHPLTLAQEPGWLLDRLLPFAHVHDLIFSATLDGPLDPARLAGALDALVRRHEPLRTTFEGDDDRPLQVVAPARPVDLAVTDLSGLPSDAREARLSALHEDALRAPYDLGRGPLVRFHLVRLEAERHRLLAAAHHLVFDGSSWTAVLDDLAALLEGRALPPLATSYGAFAARQRARHQEGLFRTHEARWREKLRDAPAAGLLTWRRPPGGRSFRGETAARLLPTTVAAGLRALAGRLGTTPFRVQLAAFHLLLVRLTGERDLVVRTGLTGRPEPGLLALAGFFLNNVPLRTDLCGAADLAAVATRVDASLRDALASEQFPFDLALRALHPEHDPANGAVHGLSFTKLPRRRDRRLTTAEGPLLLAADPYLPGGVPFDLSVYTEEGPDGLRLVSAHDTGLLTRAEADALLDGLVELLGALAMSGAGGERHPVATRRASPAAVGGSSDTQAWSDTSLARRFEATASRHAARTAVASRHESWSYARLDEEASRVAAALPRRDGEPRRIALLVGSGTSMPAAVLGVLLAGHTYVPLAPGTPRRRLALQLADSGCDALVTDGANLEAAAGLARGEDGAPPLKLVDLGRLASAPAGPRAEASPDDAAYVLYTSGTTGAPKGVAQSHRNVLHHIRCYGSSLGLTPDDRLSLLSTYAFDAGVMDVFGALLHGAALCPWDLARDGPDGLPAFLESSGVTILHATPTLFRHLAASRGAADLSRVRRVVLGGEEVHRTDLDLFRLTFSPECVLVNGYGPTESTVTLQHHVRRDAVVLGRRVPIGQAVDGTDVLLLDPEGHPVAAGQRGEIVVRSRHVALGYWRRPDLTDAAFRADPDGSGRRLYRTGDLGRERPDGSLDYLGRADGQVKRNGVRVELGEIEAALAAHPSVVEAAAGVVPRGAAPGAASRLVAYVVPAAGGAATPRELARFLAARLPSPMLPSTYVTLDALPRTPNGKLDREALPEPVAPGAARRAPATPAESALAAVWRSVLGVVRVDASDDFFDLGGHSLLALRLLARVESELGVSLPLASLFEAPTLAEQALLVDGKRAAPTTLVPIQPEGGRPPLFLVPSGEGCVRPEQLDMVGMRALSRRLGPGQPLYTFFLDVARDAPLLSVEELAERFVADLRHVQPSGPYHLAGCSLGGRIAFEMARRLEARADPVARLVLLDALAPGYPRDLRPFEREWLTTLGPRVVRLPRRLASLVRRLLRAGRGERRAVYERWAGRLAGPRRILPYRPGPYAGRVTLLRCAERPVDGRSWRDPHNGWGPWAGGGLDVVPIPGARDDIYREPGLTAVAGALRD